jgi:hypothetical protein
MINFDVFENFQLHGNWTPQEFNELQTVLSKYNSFGWFCAKIKQNGKTFFVFHGQPILGEYNPENKKYQVETIFELTVLLQQDFSIDK